MDSGSVDGVQGLVAFAGITAGAIPLVRVLFGGDVGFWLAWMPGTDGGIGAWLVPVRVIVVALTAIGLLERVKTSRGD